jgi:Tfp pilus assembly protein PilX
MSLGFKSSIVVPGLVLALLGLGVPALTLTTYAQGSPGSADDISLALEKAKLHLTEALKDMKMGNSQEASMQINMTREGIIAAEQIANATMICANTENQGYCATSTH